MRARVKRGSSQSLPRDAPSRRILVREEHLARRDAERKRLQMAEDHRLIDQFIAAAQRLLEESHRSTEFERRLLWETKTNGNITPISLLSREAT